MRTSLGWAAVTIAVLGCSSEQSSPAEAPFAITVLDEAEQPLPDAIVVVDATGGTRFETTTDAQGVAAFPEVDLKAGAVDVTAFSSGRDLVTVLGLGATSSRVLHLRLQWDEVPKRKLEVTFQNKVVHDDCVFLSGTSSSYQSRNQCGDSGEVEVRAGETGKLLALEYAANPVHDLQPPLHAAIAVDIPTDSDSVVVDFAQSAPIEHAAGSVQLPKSNATWFFHEIYVSDPTGGRASAVSQTGSSDHVDWQLDFFRPVPDADARTSLQLGWIDGDQGGIVGASIAGYPDAVGAFPALPKPPAFTQSSTLFSPIEWVADGDRPTTLFLNPATTGQDTAIWSVWFPPERDGVTLPKPPDSIWDQLSWKEDDFTVSVSYCDPEPGACGSHDCAPTESLHCARLASTVDFSHHQNEPPPGGQICDSSCPSWNAASLGQVPACCTGMGFCGAAVDATVGSLSNVPAGCYGTEQPGASDASCPALEFTSPVDGSPVAYPGCCTAVGVCGVVVDLTAEQGPNLGCVPIGDSTGKPCGGSPQCSSCMEASCATELDACGANASCIAILYCVQPCTDQACIDACMAKNAGGKAASDALQACIATQCSGAC